MEVDGATRRRLMEIDGLVTYVGSNVYKTQIGKILDGSGERAVVACEVGPWARPDPVKSIEFPLVEIQMWADRDRTGLLPGESNADDKAKALFRVIDPVFHGAKAQWWGGEGALRVVRCARYTQPVKRNARVADSLATTALPAGAKLESACWVVSYALQVYH